MRYFMNNKDILKKSGSELYHQLFSNTVAAISITSLTGEMIECNDAMESITRYSRDELIHIDMNELYTNAQDRENIVTILKREGEVNNYEVEIKQKTGTTAWTSLAVKLVELHGQKVLLTVGIDITKSKKTEKELSIFKDFAEISSLGYGFSDLKGDIVYINPKLGKMLGLKKLEDSKVVNVASFYPEDERQELIEKILPSVMEHGQWFGELPLMSIDGKITPTIQNIILIRGSNGAPLYFGNVLTDISERKLAEKATREREERLRNIIEHSNEIFFMTEEDANLSYVTPNVEDILGYELKNFINTPWIKYLTENPINQKGIDISVSTFKTGKIPELFSLEFWSKDHNRVLLEIDSSPIINNQGKVIAISGAARDITKRTQVEKALQESEKRYRSLFQTAPIVILYLTQDGTILDINPEAERLYGLKRNELIGMNYIKQFVPDQFQDYILDDIKKVASGTPTRNFENIVMLNSGKERLLSWNVDPVLDSNGKTAGIIAVGQDITERKKMEERFRLAAQVSSDLIYEWDISTSTLLWFGDIDKALGYESNEIPRTIEAWVKLIHPEDVAKLVDAVEYHKTSTDPINYTYRVQHKDGSWRYWSDYAAPVLDANNKPCKWIGTCTDITETKRLQEFASRAQRLETAGRIAGQVAHDFNNLLAPIRAYPELIKNEFEPGDAIWQYADDMETAARNIAEINNQLLTLSRRGHYNLEPHNLNESVLETVNQIYPRPENLSIKLELSSNLMNIIGGRSQIFRAIMNLIINARDAMQDSGNLTLKTENYYADKYFGDLFQIPKGEYVRLIISDTGSGIEEEHLSKIFDPFFTTKTSDKKRGSGLGLSVVHAVIEDHHGYIDCSTELNDGATFYLYFPTTRQEMETRSSEHITGGTEKILVIDDDETQRKVTDTILSKLGYDVDSVESGEKALELFKIDIYDLLLIDMIMPDGIDGTETYRRALQINPQQKAIIVSGYAESGKVQEALDMGAGDFIRKPLTIKVIAQAVRKELNREVLKNHSITST